MKTRVSFFLIFLCLFLLTQKAISGKFTDNKSYGPFSFSGSTTSTSSHLPGMTGQAQYWEATGSASISGSAIELGQDSVYDCELWLYASGDLESSSFPGKGNIAAEAESDGNGVKHKVVTEGDASIFYKSHPVGSIAPDEINGINGQTARELSGSLSSPTYSKRNYTSPTGLCASPEVHGELSGTLMNFSGSQDVVPLSFKSKENKACADSLDDGTEVVAAEKCKRKSLCQKQGTAASEDDHKVWCDKFRWVQSQNLIAKSLAGTLGITRKVKEKCKGFWWTCDDDPNDYTTFNICQHVAAHVPDSESHLEEKYVDSSGNTVDPNTVTRNCGHLLSASGDHSLQASCSTTNTNGQRCTVASFYACQSHTHTYRAPSPFLPILTAKRRCRRVLLGHTCSKGGYTTGYDTHTSRCRLWHTYWDCDPASVENHKVRTCVRCNNTYQNCEGGRNPCISGLGHAETVETAAEAPSPPQPDPSPPSETPPTTSPEDSDIAEDSDTTENEEQETEEEDTTEVPEETPPARPTAVCGSGHTYFTDGRYARNQHQDRTCLRCSQTYQNCSNHGTACQNTRWHTQDDTSYMDGACGHSHRINEKSQHASVTCSVQNSAGDTCTGGSYYACQSHTHTYPAPTAPTPSPSPPAETPSPPNNNEDTDEDTDDAPEAPSVPEPTRLNCGHLSTASGDHSYQASCTSQDSNGNYCTATSFYQCLHTSHTYPAPPPTPTPTPPTTITCGAASWTGCTTSVSSSTAHQVSCSGGHSYWTCGTSNAWHQDRTCTRCSQTYQNCSNSATACQSSKWHTETPQVVLVACGAASWTGCTSQLTSSTAHQVSCSGGHSYWTCGTSNAWHQDRTCTRCRQTYQNCGNSATACQGSRWHTE